jgi:uncharacterized membrane protein
MTRMKTEEIVLAISSSALWGIGYWALPMVKRVRPEVIQLLYSILMLVVSTIVMVARGTQVDLKNMLLQTDEGADGTSVIYLVVYLITSLVGGFINILGYQIGTVSTSGPYTAISSTYSAIAFFIVLAVNGYADINLRLKVPGVLLIVVGVILCSL